jgi:hypothetical protein
MIPRELPVCDWVYFACSAKKWSAQKTGEFTINHNLIVRTIHNSAGQRIANISHLKPGDRILLAYGGEGQPYRVLCGATIALSRDPVVTSKRKFDVFSFIEESLGEQLSAAGYSRDPVLGRYTGITISELDYLWHFERMIPRPAGNNTIWRWRDAGNWKPLRERLS